MMKVTLVLFAVLVMAALVSSCKKDKHCKHVVCSNGSHDAYCHGGECHCHDEVECTKDRHCVKRCGKNATCDHGHCHGDCTHT